MVYRCLGDRGGVSPLSENLNHVPQTEGLMPPARLDFAILLPPPPRSFPIRSLLNPILTKRTHRVPGVVSTPAHHPRPNEPTGCLGSSRPQPIILDQTNPPGAWGRLDPSPSSSTKRTHRVPGVVSTPAHHPRPNEPTGCLGSSRPQPIILDQTNPAPRLPNPNSPLFRRVSPPTPWRKPRANPRQTPLHTPRRPLRNPPGSNPHPVPLTWGNPVE